MNERIGIINGNVLSDGEFVTRDILIENDKIVEIASSIDHDKADSIIDASDLTVMPGFVDIHTHGAVRVDYNHATSRELHAVNDFFSSHGVTAYLPTVMTDTVQTMKRQLAIIAGSEIKQIAGIHLEGPFLCKKYKGAMPEELLQPFNLDLFLELNEAARQRIKVVTVAPELPGAVDFIEAVSALGVKVSLGHSSASYEQAMAAIEAGAVGTTHIMNAMKLIHMHDPAILSAALESDVYAEMICDGIHLHPPIVRLLLKIKSMDRMIAVTDSIMATGCPDGKYILGVNDIVVEYGDAKVIASGARAGSTLTMDRALRNIMDFTGLPLKKTNNLVSQNALRMLGLEQLTGTIEKGKRADLVLVDSSNNVRYTIAAGKVVFSGEHDEA